MDTVLTLGLVDRMRPTSLNLLEFEACTLFPESCTLHPCILCPESTYNPQEETDDEAAATLLPYCPTTLTSRPRRLFLDSLIHLF